VGGGVVVVWWGGVGGELGGKGDRVSLGKERVEGK